MQPTRNQKIVHIGLTCFPLRFTYWAMLVQAGSERAAEVGFKFSIAPANTADDQPHVIRRLLAQHVDVLIVDPREYTRLDLTLAIKEAIAANIPVITISMGIPGCPIACMVGVDSFKGGVLAAAYLSEHLGGVGQVALLDAPIVLPRVQGFRQEIARYPDCHLVFEAQCDWSRESAIRAMREALTHYPNLKGVYVASDPMALAACEVIRDANRLGEIAVVGYDGLPEACTAIAQGAMIATVNQMPFVVGAQLIVVAEQIIRGESVPPEFLIEPTLITRDNVVATSAQMLNVMPRILQRVVDMEEAVEQDRNLLRILIDNLPDYIYVKDIDSRFRVANIKTAHAMGGAIPDDLIGKTDADFFPAELAAQYLADERAVIASAQPLLNREEMTIDQTSGAKSWLLTSKIPFWDNQGKLAGLVGIGHDITIRKQAQETLQKFNEELEEQVQARTYELAAAYEEITILNQQLQAENLRMSAELDVSRRIQQMVLPSAEELRHIEGLEIVGYMQPADEVGGDYFDVLKEHGTIHIGIGDVTGHGLESGVLMLMTQTAIRTLIEHGETDPVVFLSTLNRILYKNIQRMHVDKTLTLAIINYAQGAVKIVGQHEEILVVRQGGRVDRVDTVNLGFPLGLEASIADFVAEATVALSPGESVVLYTDGITEAENAAKQLYGIERLCDVISQHWDQSAEAIKQAVIDDVTRFIGKQKVYDDLTLVVLKQK